MKDTGRRCSCEDRVGMQGEVSIVWWAKQHPYIRSEELRGKLNL